MIGGESGFELEECPLLVLPHDVKPPGPDPRVAARPTGSRPGLIERGLLVMVGAYDEIGAVVGGGSASPRGDVAELMGIGVTPSARRQGLGPATTVALVRACRDAGVRTVFLSAASDDAASIYRSLGFRGRATACILGTD